MNKTRVIPVRIFDRKPTGGKVEILLLRKNGDDTWLLASYHPSRQNM